MAGERGSRGEALISWAPQRANMGSAAAEQGRGRQACKYSAQHTASAQQGPYTTALHGAAATCAVGTRCHLPQRTPGLTAPARSASPACSAADGRGDSSRSFIINLNVRMLHQLRDTLSAPSMLYSVAGERKRRRWSSLGTGMRPSSARCRQADAHAAPSQRP